MSSTQFFSIVDTTCPASWKQETIPWLSSDFWRTNGNSYVLMVFNGVWFFRGIAKRPLQ